jgi:lysozyme family protein
MPSLTPELRESYQRLFDTCQINPDKYREVDAAVRLITNSQSRYEAVGNRLAIPWYFIGIIHSLEGACNFKVHLHNGDPLTARTVNVPKGRPATGTPPFSWEISAADALTLKKLDTWTDWSVPGLLYQLERYNGFGYRRFDINSPYLWSYTNHYTKGKFTADSKFSATAVSKQCGAATLMRRMSEKGIIQLTVPLLERIRLTGEQVTFSGRYHALALELQKLLNRNGFHLREDGKAGTFTSNAYHAVTGRYLKGDSRRTS